MLLKDALDEIDKQIIELLQHDPSMTHSSIATKLSRSQPAIGARIKKLIDSGILSTQVGVDFKIVADLNLVKIEIMTSKPEEVFEMAEFCPYIINAMKLSGEFNVIVFMACSNLKRIDIIVDRHFRNKDYISKVRMDLITNMAKSFVLPLDFSVDNFQCAEDECTSCERCRHGIKTILKAKTKTENK